MCNWKKRLQTPISSSFFSFSISPSLRQRKRLSLERPPSFPPPFFDRECISSAYRTSTHAKRGFVKRKKNHLKAVSRMGKKDLESKQSHHQERKRRVLTACTFPAPGEKVHEPLAYRTDLYPLLVVVGSIYAKSSRE